MLHAAHAPTAGALQEAPVSTLAFSFFFAFSLAIDGLLISSAVSKAMAMQYGFVIGELPY